MRTYGRARRFGPAALAILLGISAWAETDAPPRNVILFIGDGMGFDHLRAASYYATGGPEGLFIQSLPHRAAVRTWSASPTRTTDSAAAATALATGHSVVNGVIALEIPGTRGRLTSVTEYAMSEGRRTGVVTTDFITGATPAGFSSHAYSRDLYTRIAEVMMSDVRPHFIAGLIAPDVQLRRSPTNRVTASKFAAAGYTVISNRTGLAALAESPPERVAVLSTSPRDLFEYDARLAAARGKRDAYAIYPHLSEIVGAALTYLSASTNGFFLMVEGGLIDHAAHASQTERMILETVELDRSVKLAADWARARADTLIVVTADHETGSLKVLKGNDTKGQWPDVKWGGNPWWYGGPAGSHSQSPAPLYAWGVHSEAFSGRMKNTDLFAILTGHAPFPAAPDPEPHAPRDRARGSMGD